MRGLRLALAITLLLGGLFSPSSAEAQSAAKVARIGYLSVDLVAAPPHLHEAFRQGFRDLGYIEGRNVVIEYRDAGGKAERLPALAAELAALNVDVIMAGSTPNALAAKQATRAIPIVFLGSGDPVADGLVTSLARPGGNVTGLSSLTPERMGKCLELLTQAVPGVSRVAVLWQPGAVSERTEEDTLGEKPDGYIAYSPDGPMYTITSQSNRLKPAGLVPTNEDKVKLYDTMFAYAGSYRIDGDKVVHRIDISWNQHWTGTEQVRDFKLAGDTLTITTPVYKSSADGQDIRTVAIWKRMR